MEKEFCSLDKVLKGQAFPIYFQAERGFAKRNK